MMARRLEGKTALVTGASRGIGKTTALRLAAEGALVAVHYGHAAAAADEVVREIALQGGAAFAVQAELKQSQSIAALFEALDREFVRLTDSRELDILVNNAGLAPRAAIEMVHEAELDAVLQVNLKAPFLILQHASPRLRAGASVINVSSMATHHAFPELAAYAASKAGLEALTLLLAAHWGPRGIRANAVLPGATATDMNPRLADPALREQLATGIALRRVGEARDVADVIAFLASDEARWITGERIEVSGGQRL
jgi:NAD(P)-dependent dehydrogenase (short-subunit alcohol dehydrogenase family)